MKPIFLNLILFVFVSTSYSKCYDICPDTISLIGILQIYTVIHEHSLKGRDKIELFWILSLSNEICAKMNDDEKEADKTEGQFNKIQLMIRKDDFNKTNSYMKKKVKIRGVLYQSFNRYNISALLMDVVSIRIIN